MSDPGILVTAEEADERTRLVLDYTSRDFAAIRAQLVGLAKGFMPEWETAGEASDFGTLLLELFAYMGDVMHFYIDRTASEAFLGTAIRRQSVLYIADQFGYVPIGQQAASVRLIFGLSEQAETPLTLPPGTRVHNNPENADNLVIFELDQAVTLDPGDTAVGSEDNADASKPEKRNFITASEGITVSDHSLGISQGEPNAEYVLSDKGVIFGSITVRSQEAGRHVVWTYTSDLSLARPTQSMFTTYTDDIGWTHIVFGDNASGRIPPVNTRLYVTYRYGVGAIANDLEIGVITTVIPPPGIEVWGIEVTNPTPPAGGTDPESIESMRYSVPRAAARIKSRAVTLNDYADLAMQVPNVAKSVAHGAVYTAVYVRVAPAGGTADDTYMQKLCASVEAYMVDKVMVGSTVYAEPRSFFDLWRDIYIQMVVHVTEGYNRTLVRMAVEATVRTVLSFNQVDFGTPVSIGEIYRAALSVQGVEWVELNHLSDQPPPDEALDESTSILQTVVSELWAYDTATNVAVDPGTGRVRSNGSTRVTLSTTTDTGKVVTTPLTDIAIGDHILVRERQDASMWWSGIVTAAPINHTTWFELPMVLLDSAAAGQPRNNQQVLVTVGRYEIQAQGMVDNVMVSTQDGTNLLIPRVAPQPAVLTEAITTVVLTTNVATLTTVNPHEMVVGDTIDVTGVTPTVFNGRYEITAVGANTVSYAKTNANVASVASVGTITTVNLPESEVDFPDLSEEERTHDGLWVRAVGGLTNT